METLRKYAWILGIVGGVLVLTFLGSYAALQTIQTGFGVVGGIGAALLIAYLILDREDVAAVAKSRNTSLAGGAVLLVALALGIAVAANVLGDRYDKRWDLTSTGVYTLSEQSVQVAAALEQPVKVYGFFGIESAEAGAAFEERIASYAEHTELLDFQMIDPVAEPMLAQQMGVTSVYGTVVFEMGERSQRLETDYGEEAITNALINLSSGAEHILCFTQGHGERDLDDDFGETGFGGVILKAEGGNYTAKNFSPFQQKGIPSDCEVVLVVAPNTDFLPMERELLAGWVAQGGAMMVLLEPFSVTQSGVHPATPELAADMARYGIAVGEDIVIEADPQFMQAGLDASMVMLMPDSFDFHPVVQSLQSFVLLELARSVEAIEGTPEGLQVQVLARTSAESWAESDPASALEGELEPGEGDKIGSVGVMALSQIQDPSLLNLDPETAPADLKPGGRVLVVGDADFASNKLVLNGNNLDLFLNGVAWLVGEEEQIAIRANEAKGGQLSASLAQLILTGLLVMLVFPGLAVAAAIATWVVRRKL